MPIQHDSLLGLIDHIIEDGDHYIVSRWVDSVTIEDLVNWCAKNDVVVPHNLFLHIATGICNALEALHGRPGAATGCKAVLHLALDPRAVSLTRDGAVLIGNLGLVASPTSTAHSGGLKIKQLHISPEQTLLEEGLTPASDLFSLGAVLYEILTCKQMFAGATPLRTIAMVRRAEVTTQLLEIKEVFPGLDRVMYRVMAQNPRHRYQRAFVLREDLRALKAGYSFADIKGDARRFLAPLFAGERRSIEEFHSPLPFQAPDGETTLSLLHDSDGIEAPNLRIEDVTEEQPRLGPMQVQPSRPRYVAPTPIPPKKAAAPVKATHQVATVVEIEPAPANTASPLPVFLMVAGITTALIVCAGLVTLLGLLSST